MEAVIREAYSVLTSYLKLVHNMLKSRKNRSNKFLAHKMGKAHSRATEPNAPNSAPLSAKTQTTPLAGQVRYYAGIFSPHILLIT